MKQNDFTVGSVPKAMLWFSVPFFLTNLIQSLYNIADIMILSRYCGTDAIAGASIGGNITNTVTYMIIGLCNGGAILTSQYVGAKRGDDVKAVVSTTYTLMLLLSIVTTGVMLLCADPVLTALNTPDEAFAETKIYYNICMAGAIFVFGVNAGNSILRGLGDSKTPMYFGIGSCILNILLDLLFVGVLRMNIAGAALATIISQAAALLGSIVYLKTHDFVFDFRPQSFRLDSGKAAAIFRLGLPGAIQNMIVSGGFLIVSSITNSLGLLAASGVATAAKVNNFAQMPAGAIGMAVSSMVGQNVGARKFDRARAVLKYGIGISLGIGLLMFFMVQFFPLQLMGLIVTDREVIQTALPYLRVTAVDYLLVAFIFPLNGLCNGSGHTLFTMLPSIFSSVIARVPVAYFCTSVLHMGLAGVAVSTPTGTVSAILICAVYYFSNKWCESDNL